MKIHLHFFIEEIMKKILLIAGSVFLLFFADITTIYKWEIPCMTCRRTVQPVLTIR